MEILAQSQLDDNNANYSVAQNFIDQEIIRLHESIRVLKSRRNKLSPVSRLPPELVCKIFQFYQDALAVEAFPSNPYKWVTVTHVSRRWMEIAVDNPSLWSNIVIRHWPEWEREAFVRSQNAPLSVLQLGMLSSDQMSEIAFVQLVLGQLNRIAELSLDFMDSMTMNTLLSNIPPSSPILSSLTIRTRWMNTVPISDKIFPNCPCLRSLTLINCVVDWEWSAFANLVHLSLLGTGGFRPSLTNLLFALKRSTSLETLDLYEVLPNSGAGVDPSEEIFLPRLTMLRIHGTITEAATTLPHIFFPDHTIISIRCDTTNETHENEYFNIFSVFTRPSYSTRNALGSHIPAKIIRFLKLRNAFSTVRFEAWQDSNTQDSSAANILAPNHTADIEFYVDGLGLNTQDITIRACRTLELVKLETLWLSGETSISAYMWTEIFGDLDKLGSIHLEHDSMIEFLHAMDALTPSSRNRPFLPSLHHLSVRRIYFSSHPSPLDLLEKSFMKRREEGAFIHTLTLTECRHLKAEDVGRLEQVIENVEWDQLVIEY